MKNYLNWSIILAVSSILIFNNCEKNPTGEEAITDEIAIRELIESDPEVFNQQGINDDGDQPMEYSSDETPKLSEQINTVRFGRKGKFRLESIEVEFFGEPDTLAIATITRSFDGEFVVVERDTNPDTPEDYIIYKKDMNNILIRKAKFKRVANTRNPRRNWKIFEVSMGEGYSDLTTIEIQELRIVMPDGQEIVVDSPLPLSFQGIQPKYSLP
jgi:hypothetical protein